MKLITHTRRAFTALAFLGLLTSNVLTLTNGAFNAALSGLMGKAFGISTVADAMNTRLAKKNAQIASQKAAMKTQKRRLKDSGGACLPEPASWWQHPSRSYLPKLYPYWAYPC